MRCGLPLASVCALLTLMACGGQESTTAPSPATPAAPTLTKLEVEASVASGQPAHGTAAISAAAPEGGLTITLAADNAAVIVPSSLTIPAGATSATFEIATRRVTTTTDVTISAQAGQVTRTSSVRLRIDPASVRPTASYTVGFSGFSANQAAVTSYLESGFTISSVSAEWVAITTYGSPQPSIQFFAPAGVTRTGEIRITAGGAPFWLSSLDLYSSTTRIPYVIEGFLSSEQVYTVLNALGNTFGNFVRTANPEADVPVDVLLIRLSNPAAPCCSNPMGVDNLVLNR